MARLKPVNLHLSVREFSRGPFEGTEGHTPGGRFGQVGSPVALQAFVEVPWNVGKIDFVEWDVYGNTKVYPNGLREHPAQWSI
jgi:hypothetical protein